MITYQDIVADYSRQLELAHEREQLLLAALVQAHSHAQVGKKAAYPGGFDLIIKSIRDDIIRYNKRLKESGSRLVSTEPADTPSEIDN